MDQAITAYKREVMNRSPLEVNFKVKYKRVLVEGVKTDNAH